jgi:hypothetical protein
MVTYHTEGYGLVLACEQHLRQALDIICRTATSPSNTRTVVVYTLPGGAR